MLSKPVEKTTHVSLVPDFTPGSSSGVRNGRTELLYAFVRQRLHVTDKIPQIRVDLHACGSYQEPLVNGECLDNRMYWLFSRAAPIDMAWRHHDSCVANPFPRPSEYNASDVAKLREHADHAFSIKDSNGKVIAMAEFLRLPNFKGCKVSVMTLLPRTTRVTHLAPPVGRLEDILPKTGDMIVAEMPCWKVLDDKEKKRKAEEKVAARAPAANVQVDAAANKGAGKEGPRKKRRVRVGPQVPYDSEHVSSPTPLSKAKPLEALANEEHASLPLSIGRMDTLRDQTDEHATSPGLTREGGETLMLPMPLRVTVTTRVAYSDYRLVPPSSSLWPFWKPSLYSSMGAHGIKLYGQLVLEELEKEKREADQLNSSQADRIRQLEEALKQSEADAQQLRVEKERYAVEAGQGEMVFSLAIGKGFMDGISIGREDANVQAILQATPDVDPASFDIFMDAYEKLFDQRYLYVDKVSCMYILDPNGLHNIMPNETGPTLGGGPRDTPKASYA
nr:hypothetical protein [Tanacetum cinerariifolium]